MITSAAFIKSGAKFEHCPEGDKPEFAFIGRSNVGKSSLINALCKRKNLAQTSPKPGKTQLMNFFDIEFSTNHGKKISFILTDLPGYGYAKVSKEKRFQFEDMIAEYLTQRENLQMIFVLVDSAIPPQKIDIEFISWLDEQELPYVIVFTKSDKSTQKILHHHTASFLTTLGQQGIVVEESFILSAHKSATLAPLESFIEELL